MLAIAGLVRKTWTQRHGEGTYCRPKKESQFEVVPKLPFRFCTALQIAASAFFAHTRTEPSLCSGSWFGF